jgi:hypothetical protein
MLDNGTVRISVMQNQTEYFTVTGDHPAILDQEVNARLAKGWRLQGGVAIAVVRTAVQHIEGPNDREPQLMWAQAMVKPVESEFLYAAGDE